jgi:hypothetical protein
MSGKPAAIPQKDMQRVIRAAKAEGAAKVEVRIRDAVVIIHISDEKQIAPEEEIIL